eukprot:3666803-Karenia_brevis.AAC.1
MDYHTQGVQATGQEVHMPSKAAGIHTNHRAHGHRHKIEPGDMSAPKLRPEGRWSGSANMVHYPSQHICPNLPTLTTSPSGFNQMPWNRPKGAHCKAIPKGEQLPTHQPTRDSGQRHRLQRVGM